MLRRRSCLCLKPQQAWSCSVHPLAHNSEPRPVCDPTVTSHGSSNACLAPRDVTMFVPASMRRMPAARICMHMSSNIPLPWYESPDRRFVTRLWNTRINHPAPSRNNDTSHERPGSAKCCSIRDYTSPAGLRSRPRAAVSRVSHENGPVLGEREAVWLAEPRSCARPGQTAYYRASERPHRMTLLSPNRL